MMMERRHQGWSTHLKPLLGQKALYFIAKWLGMCALVPECLGVSPALFHIVLSWANYSTLNGANYRIR